MLETNTNLPFSEKIETLYDMADELLHTISAFSNQEAAQENMEPVRVLEELAQAQYEILKKIALSFPSEGGGCGSGGCGSCSSGCGV
ncbi:MAG: hypothetical protein U9Q15_01685 [Patescibacteria group bacterium]|nr:hypothetical protein [Patescibacteria group bacterium]